MTALIIILLAGSCFSYFIYPAIIWSANRLRRSRAPVVPPPGGDDALPSVTLIITARNEERRIADKLRNTQQVDYPRDKLEVILASDASDDDTERIAKEVAPEVRIVRSPRRLGKEHAQLCAIRQATGDVCVFSDVATSLEPNGIRLLVAPLADPSVGATSSEDRFVAKDGTIVGEGMYIRFEMWLRREESRFGSLVGLSGSLFAVRRSLCEAWDTNVPSDFNVAIICARNGLRAVTAPGAYGIYTGVERQRSELERKIRTVLRGITALIAQMDVLNPFRYGSFAFQVAGHKLMRWLAPFFMLGLLVATIGSAPRLTLASWLLGAQVLFYGVASLPLVSRWARGVGPLVAVHFFVMTNMAIVRAWLLYFRGVRMSTWEPSRR